MHLLHSFASCFHPRDAFLAWQACLMGFADIVKELLVQPCFSLVRAKVEQGERPSDGIDDMDGPGADVMIRTRYLAVLPELELSG
mmetsp:Transcript_38427/g.121036  ORF Transcript_38427/g.121036 Transcript_38427/m.121036 type:complete len:85 (+) Transcript_38427:1065-1319(+)